MASETEVAELRVHIVPVFVHIKAYDAQEAIQATSNLFEVFDLDDDPYAPGFVSNIFVGNEREVAIAEPEDDDPRCACGVYRSEHAMMGCPDGFQTPAQWETEKQHIYERAMRDEEGYNLYGDEDYESPEDEIMDAATGGWDWWKS